MPAILVLVHVALPATPGVEVLVTVSRAHRGLRDHVGGRIARGRRRARARRRDHVAGAAAPGRVEGGSFVADRRGQESPRAFLEQKSYEQETDIKQQKRELSAKSQMPRGLFRAVLVHKGKRNGAVHGGCYAPAWGRLSALPPAQPTTSTSLVAKHGVIADYDAMHCPAGNSRVAFLAQNPQRFAYGINAKSDTLERRRADWPQVRCDCAGVPLRSHSSELIVMQPKVLDVRPRPRHRGKGLGSERERERARPVERLALPEPIEREISAIHAFERSHVDQRLQQMR
nr:hypothetical protein CFP56_52286 [Quercus suber]